jgi:lipopolysaccharide/colanic/teichoic acid biosynthesis glycosyltransferase
MYKLRTMVHDAEKDGPVFAAESDPRIIPGGGLLRRLRIDELPQLWNVLRGDMSLVGPRPERPEMATELSEEIPYYSFRMAVPPGITGWAQVNIPYARDLDDHKRKLEFDLYFIRERSPRLYMLTLLRTVNAALVGARLPDEAHAEAPEEVAGAKHGTTGLSPRDRARAARSETPKPPGRGAREANGGPLAPSAGPAAGPTGTR